MHLIFDCVRIDNWRRRYNHDPYHLYKEPESEDRELLKILNGHPYGKTSPADADEDGKLLSSQSCVTLE